MLQIHPHLTVHPSPGIPNASPATSGHTTNDSQLLLHDPEPAHHHTTVPPATGQHHPTVCPGPAPALLQLSATAAAAKVSIWIVTWSRGRCCQEGKGLSIGRCSGSSVSHDPGDVPIRTVFWEMTEEGAVWQLATATAHRYRIHFCKGGCSPVTGGKASFW